MPAQRLGIEHGLGRQVRQRLHHVEEKAPVAVGLLQEAKPCPLVQRQPVPEMLLGPPEQGTQRFRPQPLQHQHVAARDQSTRERERGILGRGPDQCYRAVLDLVQQPVLLGAVEAVDLVDEQQRPPPARPQPARLLVALAQVGDPGHHRRERQQRLIHLPRQQPGERGLPAARRPPQDQRGQPPPRQHPRQRRLGRQQVLLAHKLAQLRRPQQVGKGPVARGAGQFRRRLGKQVGHGNQAPRALLGRVLERPQLRPRQLVRQQALVECGQ